MLNLTRQKYFYYIAFMLMVTTYLPIVYNNMPAIARSHHIWTLLWTFSLLVYYPQIFFAKGLVYIYSYGLLLIIANVIIWSDLNIWYNTHLFYELYVFAIGISVITYFLQTKDYISLAKITKWSIIFMFITAVMTIVSSTIDPLYVRNLTSISALTNESEIQTVLSMKRYGGGTYSSAGSFMCLFPIIIYYYKNIRISVLSKNMLIVLSVVFFFALLGMQLFANILIAFIFCGLALLNQEKIKRFKWILVLLLFTILIIPSKLYVNSLITISDSFNVDSELHYKFRDLAIFVETGADINDKSTAAGGRSARYPLLLDSFIKSPFFGVFSIPQEMKKIEGGGGFHLYWMYKLVTTGIIMFIIFIYIPYEFTNNNLRYFNPSYKFYYILASLAVLSYGLFKVIDGRETWYTFFIILPGLSFLPLLKKNHGV